MVGYVPSALVKYVLTQGEIDGKRAQWIAKSIEFNIEVRTTKLVKCQFLVKLMGEENCSLIDINCMGPNSDDE